MSDQTVRERIHSPAYHRLLDSFRQRAGSTAILDAPPASSPVPDYSRIVSSIPVETCPGCGTRGPACVTCLHPNAFNFRQSSVNRWNAVVDAFAGALRGEASPDVEASMVDLVDEIDHLSQDLGTGGDEEDMKRCVGIAKAAALLYWRIKHPVDVPGKVSRRGAEAQSVGAVPVENDL